MTVQNFPSRLIIGLTTVFWMFHLLPTVILSLSEHVKHLSTPSCQLICSHCCADPLFWWKAKTTLHLKDNHGCCPSWLWQKVLKVGVCSNSSDDTRQWCCVTTHLQATKASIRWWSPFHNGWLWFLSRGKLDCPIVWTVARDATSTFPTDQRFGWRHLSGRRSSPSRRTQPFPFRRRFIMVRQVTVNPNSIRLNCSTPHHFTYSEVSASSQYVPTLSLSLWFLSFSMFNCVSKWMLMPNRQTYLGTASIECQRWPVLVDLFCVTVSGSPSTQISPKGKSSWWRRCLPTPVGRYSNSHLNIYSRVSFFLYRTGQKIPSPLLKWLRAFGQFHQTFKLFGHWRLFLPVSFTLTDMFMDLCTVLTVCMHIHFFNHFQQKNPFSLASEFRPPGFFVSEATSYGTVSYLMLVDVEFFEIFERCLKGASCLQDDLVHTRHNVYRESVKAIKRNWKVGTVD